MALLGEANSPLTGGTEGSEEGGRAPSCGAQGGGGKFVPGGPTLWKEVMEEVRKKHPKASLRRRMKLASPIYRRRKTSPHNRGTTIGSLRKNRVSRSAGIKIMRKFYGKYGSNRAMRSDMRKRSGKRRLLKPGSKRSYLYRYKRSGRHGRKVSRHTGPAKYDLIGVDAGKGSYDLDAYRKGVLRSNRRSNSRKSTRRGSSKRGSKRRSSGRK